MVEKFLLKQVKFCRLDGKKIGKNIKEILMLMNVKNELIEKI